MIEISRWRVSQRERVEFQNEAQELLVRFCLQDDRVTVEIRMHLHTHTHATFYTRSPKIRTNALSHKETFTSRPCYIQTLLHGRRGETSQLIGSLQEQKLARKKITESDDCLSSSSILPAQKDDATFLFCPDGRATKPSGFHTASKKSSVPTGLLPASL